MKYFTHLVCLLAVLLVSGIGQAGKQNSSGTPGLTRPQDVLVLGFMGGWNKPDDTRFGVGRLAQRLRGMNLPCVRVATVANDKRDEAMELVRDFFDRNHDGRLDAAERASMRLILYGQSRGGAAIIQFARQLKAEGIPVLLTVQVDAVGRNDELIPSNVAAAANLFQDDGFVHGPREIRAEDQRSTEIVGNFQFHYRDSTIDLSDLPWRKRVFEESHVRMDRDAAVWSKVEELILAALARSGPCRSF